jgi:putative ABC transport system permease protein
MQQKLSRSNLLVLSAVAGVLFGLVPALQSTRPDITPTLKGAEANPGKRRFSLQSALMGMQMAISVILLVGGGLSTRALCRCPPFIMGQDPPRL